MIKVDWLLPLVGLMLLSACVENTPLQSIAAFKVEVEGGVHSEIEPLPAIEASERFQYAAEELGNPFDRDNVFPRASLAQIETATESPDKDRRREPLERFQLDSLRMVGTMLKGTQIWAVVRAPDESVYLVTAGDYMGKHSGQVSAVEDGRIVLNELVRDANNQWGYEEASMALSE